MKKNLPPPKNTERGQSLVELALSLVILISLLTGAVEFSLALFQYVTIRDAAQEGATYGSIEPTETDAIKWRVLDAANDVVDVDIDKITITINGAACEGSTVPNVPNSIQVKVDYPHEIVFPFVPEMIGSNTINLSATVTNTILEPACLIP